MKIVDEEQGSCMLSVIVPIYNAGPYLHKCIDSILAQTFKDFELILVNDGSVDGSGMICDEYINQDERVKVYHKENGGLVTARKVGLVHARGKYIGFVDADDHIEPIMFETLVACMEESGADFIHTGYIEENFNFDSNIFGFEEGLYELPQVEDRKKFLVEHVLHARKERISNSIWSKLFRKELIVKCYLQLPDEQQFGEDLLCLCLCILESRRILMKRYALYHYIVRNNTLSHIPKREYVIKYVELCFHLINILKKQSDIFDLYLKDSVCFFVLKDFMAITEMVKVSSVKLQYFYMKNVDRFRGMRVAIYGAGNVGQDYYVQLCRYKDIEIVAWIDSNWRKCQFEYADVVSLQSLQKYEYEKIIIAVEADSMAKEIETILIKHGISEEKIFWERPTSILEAELS